MQDGDWKLGITWTLDTLVAPRGIYARGLAAERFARTPHMQPVHPPPTKSRPPIDTYLPINTTTRSNQQPRSIQSLAPWHIGVGDSRDINSTPRYSSSLVSTVEQDDCVKPRPPDNGRRGRHTHDPLAEPRQEGGSTKGTRDRQHTGRPGRHGRHSHDLLAEPRQEGGGTKGRRAQ